MAAIGVFTDVGIERIRDVTTNPGFKIIPTRFGTSNQATPGGNPALKALTSANSGLFYQGLVSSAVEVGDDSIQVSGTIPPGQTPGQEMVNELYIYAQDVNAVEFLLAVAQPQAGSNILYDPSGETTLRLQLKVTNADLGAILEFNYTQAMEISEHNQDPNAHPDIRAALAKAGIFTQTSSHEYIGQHYDEFAEFDSSVSEGMVVYKAANGVYFPALQNSSISEKVAGVAFVARGLVALSGAVSIAHGYAAGTRLYLSDAAAGQVTALPTKIPLGVALDLDVLALRVDEPLDVASQIDAVVSSQSGRLHFADAQEAIDFVPAGGYVRFDESYPVRGAQPLSSNGKPVNLVFTGPSSGLEAYPGENSIQTVSFGTVPTAGDFVLVYNSDRTSRMNFNASAAAVKAAIETLPGVSLVSVVGNFSTGFTIEFQGPDGLQPQPLLLANVYAGNNEVQLLDFNSNDFDSGSFRLSFQSQLTAAIAFNSINAATIQAALDDLGAVDQVTVTAVASPSPANHTQFLIEFQGANGLSPQPLTVAPSGDNSLADSIAQPITIAITVATAGVYPDNRLTTSGNPVVISTAIVNPGELPGPSTALELDTPACQVIGLGRIQGFAVGIDLNSQPLTRIEMLFDNIPTPIIAGSLQLSQYNTDGSIGLPEQVGDETLFRLLAKVNSSAVPNSLITVTPAYLTASDGSRHGLQVGLRVSTYNGGSVNFNTGAISTGGSFTPYVASAPGVWFRYAIVLRPDSSIAVIGPSGPSDEGVSAAAAAYPAIANGLLRAIVTVQAATISTVQPIGPANIQHFFSSGAVNYEQAEIPVSMTSTGQAIFDLSTVTSLLFDPDNSVIDIAVTLNGVDQVQDQTGGTGQDYRKISTTQIEFNMVIPAGAQLVVTYLDSTQVSGSGPSSPAAQFLQTEKDGVALPSKADTYNFVGDNLDVQEISAGRHQIAVLPQEGTNVGTGNGEVFKERVGLDLFFRRIRGVGGVYVGMDGDDIVISLSNSAYFREFRTSLTGTNITSAGLYDLGQYKLAPFRNGLRLIETLAIGAPIDRFQEDSSRVKINLSVAASPSDLFAFVHSNTAPAWVGLYDGNALEGESVLATPMSYVVGSDRIRAYRNGMLMNSAGYGALSDRYVESGLNEITLADPLQLGEWVFIEYEGLAPLFQEDIQGIVGNTLTLANQYTVGSNHLLVYKNGLLLNDVGLGAVGSRYSEVGGVGTPSNVLSLGVNANSADRFTVILKS